MGIHHPYHPPILITALSTFQLLTAEVTDLEEQTVAVSEETPSTSDAAPLFFIDKTATGQAAEGVCFMSC